jgi:hypothetical protein
MQLTARIMTKRPISDPKTKLYIGLFHIIELEDDEDEQPSGSKRPIFDNINQFQTALIHVLKIQPNFREDLRIFQYHKETILEKAVNYRCVRIVDLLVNENCYNNTIWYQCDDNIDIASYFHERDLQYCSTDSVYSELVLEDFNKITMKDIEKPIIHTHHHYKHDNPEDDQMVAAMGGMEIDEENEIIRIVEKMKKVSV